jgi:hypothetical protein
MLAARASVLAALVLKNARVAVTGRQGSDALTADVVIVDMIFADAARTVGSFHVQRARGFALGAGVANRRGNRRMRLAPDEAVRSVAGPLFSLIQVKAISPPLRDALATVPTRGGEAHELQGLARRAGYRCLGP